MESPPSCSAKSSEDSGLLLTSDSISTSSGNWQFTMELLESEGEKSLDSVSLGEGYNTVKKGPGLCAIDPPLEFQDTPPEIGGRRARVCYTPDLVHRRPASRNSLSSRLSSSHNSLSVPVANKADDSSFITSAMSHDILTTITDMYNVPFDSDIYTLPVDSLRPCPQRPKRQHRHHRKRRRHTTHSDEVHPLTTATPIEKVVSLPVENKRHSVPGTSGRTKQTCEPIHMTLQEVRQFLHSLYSSASDSSGELHVQECDKSVKQQPELQPNRKNRKNTFAINIKNRKSKEHSEQIQNDKMTDSERVEKTKKTPHGKNSFSNTLKQTLCNLFRFRRSEPPPDTMLVLGVPCSPPFSKRALPPLPVSNQPDTTESLDCVDECEETNMDFASSIEKVKDYGWYWGPISGEAAEKILSNEPDGSFIVRDSSDDHYIFSLTFKLNGCVRHVRIEHDQGNFSFGSCTKFKSNTIVEFIENAVEHSRSGRYLFFLHRRPVLGPMRVQLLHPVSRFKQVQSLQHMCRFVILKLVRRDLIPALPLPRRVIDYLSSPHYFSENLVLDDDPTSVSPSLHVFSFAPPHSHS